MAFALFFSFGTSNSYAVEGTGTPTPPSNPTPQPTYYEGPGAAERCTAGCIDACTSISFGYWSCYNPKSQGTQNTGGSNTSTTGTGSSGGGNTDGTESPPRSPSVGNSLVNFAEIAAGYGESEGAKNFLGLAYQAILPIVIILGMIFVAVAGYGIMTSQGDPTKAQEAKEQLTSAIMGLLFILLGAGILRAIISTLIEGKPSGF